LLLTVLLVTFAVRVVVELARGHAEPPPELPREEP
jgi:hypothetical protein